MVVLAHCQVILGGGRLSLQGEEGDKDINDIDTCIRSDGLDLIEAWKAERKKNGASHEFVDTKEALLSSKNPDYLLGNIKTRIYL